MNLCPWYVTWSCVSKDGPTSASVDIEIPKTEVLPRVNISDSGRSGFACISDGHHERLNLYAQPERWDATLMYEGVFDNPVQHHNMTHNQKGDGYKGVQRSLHFIWSICVCHSRMRILKNPTVQRCGWSIVAYGADWEMGRSSVLRPANDCRRSPKINEQGRFSR